MGTTPEAAKKLIELGFAVELERGAGAGAGFADASYEEAGVVLRDAVWDLSLIHISEPTRPY